MNEILALILSGILVYGMGYVLYQHFVTPFKMISKAKKDKVYADRVKSVENDIILNERLKPHEKALKDKKISVEEFATIYMILVNERVKELEEEEK